MKVMPCEDVPASGAVDRVVHAKVPLVLAEPPDSVEPDSVCP